jgi:hypothetical protein
MLAQTRRSRALRHEPLRRPTSVRLIVLPVDGALAAEQPGQDFGRPLPVPFVTSARLDTFCRRGWAWNWCRSTTRACATFTLEGWQRTWSLATTRWSCCDNSGSGRSPLRPTPTSACFRADSAS